MDLLDGLRDHPHVGENSTLEDTLSFHEAVCSLAGMEARYLMQLPPEILQHVAVISEGVWAVRAELVKLRENGS